MIEKKFVQYVEQSIKKNWNISALSDYNTNTITYGEVGLMIKKLHKLFEFYKIQKGDKITLIGKNSINWALTYLATTCYGAVIVPLLSDFRPKDIIHLTNHSDAVILFSSESIYKTIDIEEMPHLNAVFSLENFSLLYDKKNDVINIEAKLQKEFTNIKTSQNDFNINEISNNELMCISYTSGTSGFSKGVMLSHNSLAANIKTAINCMRLDSGDSVLSFLPLAHAYGCAFEFLFPFAYGCHITFLGKIPTPQVIIKAFMTIKPKLILTVPLIIEKIYKKNILPKLNKPLIKFLTKIPFVKDAIYHKIHDRLSNVFGGNYNEIVVGGAALSKEVELFLNKIGFKFSVGYGMTECGPLISYAGWRERRIYSCGKLIETLEIRILSDDPYKIPGEICVKGENIMLGYYKNEGTTNQAIDDEGWLHTGDLGIIDRKNHIYIMGRSKSMILGASGQNIYPEEIEAILNNVQLIQESLIVERNGKIVAMVYPDFDYMNANNIDKETLKKKLSECPATINSQLPKYMSISKIIIVKEEFEKTPKKSIKRFLYTSPNHEVHALS